MQISLQFTGLSLLVTARIAGHNNDPELREMLGPQLQLAAQTLLHDKHLPLSEYPTHVTVAAHLRQHHGELGDLFIWNGFVVGVNPTSIAPIGVAGLNLFLIIPGSVVARELTTLLGKPEDWEFRRKFKHALGHWVFTGKPQSICDEQVERLLAVNSESAR